MNRLAGLDLDNTLVRYDGLFAAVAEELGLFSPAPPSKRALRDALRARPGGEAAWRELQARVYGLAIARAEPAPGATAFLDSCRREGLRLCVISHKTATARLGDQMLPLREPALAWLDQSGFFDPKRSPLTPADVFFCDTRAEKLACIAAAGCRWFVDDLAEVLDDPAFPAATQGLLYAPDGGPADAFRATVCRDWDEVGRHILSRDGRD